MLMLLAGRIGRDHAMADSTGVSMDNLTRLHRELFEVPHHLSRELESGSPTFKAIGLAAEATSESKGFFFIGRGYSYPLALEGALKLKEIAYVHAEGYAAGELKHGPIAMLEPSYTVVVIAPRDLWYEKTVSNLQEVKARGARIVAIGHADDEQLASMCDFFIPLPITQKKADGTPTLDACLSPFLIAPVLQLFSYQIALMKGTDVDQPRNLAKECDRGMKILVFAGTRPEIIKMAPVYKAFKKRIAGIGRFRAARISNFILFFGSAYRVGITVS